MPLWGWIVIGLVLAFGFNARWSVQRDLSKNGVSALATIIRIEGGDRSASDPGYATLTLKWHDADGRKRTIEKGASCDIAEMPRERDQTQITSLPNDWDYIELQNYNAYLRHDQLTPGGDL